MDMNEKFDELKQKEENIKSREQKIKEFQESLGSTAKPANWPLPFKWARPFMRHNICNNLNKQ
jgi:hypothetical protein